MDDFEIGKVYVINDKTPFQKIGICNSVLEDVIVFSGILTCGFFEDFSSNFDQFEQFGKNTDIIRQSRLAIEDEILWYNITLETNHYFWSDTDKVVQRIFFASDINVNLGDKIFGITIDKRNTNYKFPPKYKLVPDIIQYYDPDKHYICMSGNCYTKILPWTEENMELFHRSQVEFINWRTDETIGNFPGIAKEWKTF